MSMFSVYWLIKLDVIADIIAGIAGFGCGAFAILGIFWLQGHDGTDSRDNPIDEGTKQKRMQRIAVSQKSIFVIVPITVFLFILSAMIPSTKEMCAIIVVPKIVNAASNNEALKNMPNVIITTANEWIRQLTPANIKDGTIEIIQGIKK